jgi:hypothetical protein
MFQRKFVEKIKTHFVFNAFLSLSLSLSLSLPKILSSKGQCGKILWSGAGYR